MLVNLVEPMHNLYYIFELFDCGLRFGIIHTFGVNSVFLKKFCIIKNVRLECVEV